LRQGYPGDKQAERERIDRPQPADHGGDCICLTHHALLLGLNRGDFKPITVFVSLPTLC
jgi:hypothetical protein